MSRDVSLLLSNFHRIDFHVNILYIARGKPASSKTSRQSPINLNLNPKYKTNEQKMPKGPKYIVVVTWFNEKTKLWERNIGAIIDKQFILTYGNNDSEQIKEGYCVLSHDLSHGVGSKDIIKWRKIKYCAEHEKNEQNVALIKLDEKINLDDKNFISLDIYSGFDKSKNKEKVASIFSISADEKLVYSAVKYESGKETANCKSFGDCITIYNGDVNICKRILPRGIGSPVVFENKIIGTVRRTTCQDYTDFAFSMNPVYKYTEWIENSKIELLQDPPQKFSEFYKYMAFYGYEIESNTVIRHAAIIGESMLITNYAENLHDDINNRFVTYGTPNIRTLRPPISIQMKYNETFILSKPPFKPNDLQLTLIKLEGEIQFSKKAIALPFLKTRYPPKGARCFVVTTFNQRTNHEDFTYGYNYKFLKNEIKLHHIEIELWTYLECKEYIEDLNINHFCISVHHTINNDNHCLYIKAGSPIICDSHIIGIVNDVTPCESEIPRLCTNLHSYKDSIVSEIRKATEEYIEKKEIEAKKLSKENAMRDGKERTIKTQNKYLLPLIIILSHDMILMITRGYE
uniref:Uncharacterized protein n=1 Tax=Glossina brevipalpis TaxID=37001 RepID=A0A1A9WDD8_9MUSC